MRALLAGLCFLTLFATVATAQTTGKVGDHVYVGNNHYIGKVHVVRPDGYVVKVKRWYQPFARKKIFYKASAVTIRRT